MNNEKKVKVSALKIGDFVETETLDNGGIKTTRIKEINNGFYRSSKLITWATGKWSCLLNNDVVKIINHETTTP